MAYATIYFTTARNDEGERQLAVFAQCQMSGNVVGPVWGHAEQSVRRVLAQLTHDCNCPAVFHKSREFQGRRVSSNKKSSRH